VAGATTHKCPPPSPLFLFMHGCMRRLGQASAGSTTTASSSLEQLAGVMLENERRKAEAPANWTGKSLKVQELPKVLAGHAGEFTPFGSAYTFHFAHSPVGPGGAVLDKDRHEPSYVSSGAPAQVVRPWKMREKDQHMVKFFENIVFPRLTQEQRERVKPALASVKARVSEGGKQAIPQREIIPLMPGMPTAEEAVRDFKFEATLRSLSIEKKSFTRKELCDVVDNIRADFAKHYNFFLLMLNEMLEYGTLAAEQALGPVPSDETSTVTVDTADLVEEYDIRTEAANDSLLTMTQIAEGMCGVMDQVQLSVTEAVHKSALHIKDQESSSADGLNVLLTRVHEGSRAEKVTDAVVASAKKLIGRSRGRGTPPSGSQARGRGRGNGRARGSGRNGARNRGGRRSWDHGRGTGAAEAGSAAADAPRTPVESRLSDGGGRGRGQAGGRGQGRDRGGRGHSN